MRVVAEVVMEHHPPTVRYDVFLSSTWKDFQDIRPVITQDLQKAEYVVRGMEQFPAMNDDVFRHIKNVIDECSYYVVVSGSRYGSISPGYGKSYTHLEYEYARSRGIPSLCFLLDDEQLRLTSDHVSEELKSFRTQMMNSGLVDLFKRQEELPGKIVAALKNRLASTPKTFWIKSSEADLQTHTRVRAEGLVGLNADSNVPDLSTSIRDSSKFFAMLNDGYNWGKKYINVLNERFSDPAKSTTIVLLDPLSPSLPAIARRSNKRRKEQTLDIWDTVKRLTDGPGFAAHESGRFRLLACQQPISSCYFIFDDYLVWNPYLTRFRPPQLPRIELSRAGGRLTELLMMDAEVIEREIIALGDKGDLIARLKKNLKIQSELAERSKTSMPLAPLQAKSSE
jgi:Domain of unknown function (DUF4062)